MENSREEARVVVQVREDEGLPTQAKAVQEECRDGSEHVFRVDRDDCGCG